jgi:S1-C subfamily serine protease
MSQLRRLAATPLVAAIVGGLVTAAAFIVSGVGDTTKSNTIVQQAPVSGTPVSGQRGLTARDIYKAAAPGVVYIKSQIVQQSENPFDLLPQQQRGEATGSGFVIDKDGRILTNAHVIDGATKVTVQFEDHTTRTAKVLGRDTSSDLAVLKVDPDGLSLHPLTLGDSKTVQVGDPTIAIGNPFGLDRTLTTGVVSALQRRIQAPDGFSIDHVIQTDAAINPGNSGGPLLDAAGRVIGINSQIQSAGTDGNIGIGFAVPIDTAKRVIPELEKNGKVSHAYAGITGVTIDASLNRLNLAVKKGVLIQSVAPGSPADKAGLRGGDSSVGIDGQDLALGGDVIVKLDGKDVTSMDQVASAVSDKKPGDKVKLTIIRDGKRKDVELRLGDRPSRVSG